MDNKSREPTWEDVSNKKNYNFNRGFVDYKGKMMSKAQVGHHLKLLRNMEINPNNYMWGTLKKMLMYALENPYPFNYE